MNKKKSIVTRLIRWLIVLALLAAFVVFIGIPLFTEDETSHAAKPIVGFYDGAAKPYVMENDSLLFELDANTTHFTLTDKRSGQVWSSNPADAAKDPIALGTNKDWLQATLVVTYATSSGTIDMDNFKYSITDKLYTIEPQEDGSIKVVYTVGKVEKNYVIPIAITADRFKFFTDAMGKANAKKTKSNYALYEPDKLEGKKDRDQIVAMYPEVLNQPLYILKTGTSDTNKGKLQEYFAAGGYNQEEYEIDMQLVAGSKTVSSAVFNVSMIYRLDGDDFVVELPYGDIRYDANYPITAISPLPLFGAGGKTDEGYLFVPEGGGAIIDFNNGKLAQNSYYANLYGWDYASDRKEAASETDNIFPVFGVARNGAAFICVMDGAASYGQVYADISGRYNSYNTVYGRYRVLHNDQYNISAKTANLVYMYEKEIPDNTVVQRYRFVGSDSYVDMARSYGDYLEATYPELAQGGASETVPVSVELIGAIDKTVVKFGLPIDSVIPTTTFAQGGDIMDDLLSRGVRNMSLRFTGWCNGGVTQKVLSRVRVERVLGGTKGMDALIARAKSADVPLYFDGISCFAYDSGILQGFIPFRDAARYTTREQCQLYPFSEITYMPQEKLDAYYLVIPSFAKEKASNLIGALSKRSAAGVAFRDIGNLLSGNYHPKQTVTREQVKQMNLDTMQEAHDAGLRVMIKHGNDYAVPYADLITEMDLNGYTYAIFDRMVPFYQIALHGRKDYTGEALNLAGDPTTQLLRCAEYGAGLHFSFFNESARIVQDTLHSRLYGASYADWAERAAEMVTRYQADMEGLNRQPIVDHEILQKDVTVTRYGDGTEVYVNYGSLPYSAGGVKVPAQSYVVKGGNAQ